MKQDIGPHPGADTLSAFGLGQLSPIEQAEVERHVAECAICCRELAAVPSDTLVSNLRGAQTSVQPADPRATMAFHGDIAAASSLCLPRELQEHPRYRIVKLLGKGGMGEVYQAEHLLMERTVALKVINLALIADPHAIERFRTEVKAAGRLQHANIVAAHDAEQAGDLHFLVMEYIDGINLARLVEKKGPLEIAGACHYIRQAALGLHHAFEHGMVHRDIKPHNIMLTRQGQVKVLDFGLARLVEGTQRRITQVGSVVGTPDFIAPEQVKDSHGADIRADIYSLGCTLYFLLTGQPPFPQGTMTQKVHAHVRRDPLSVRQLRPEVPQELSDIVARMMAKTPEERYRTPRDVAQALMPYCKASQVEVVPANAVRAGSAGDRGSARSRTATMNANPILEDNRRRKSDLRSSRRWLLPVGVLAILVLVSLVGVAFLRDPGKKKEKDDSGPPVNPIVDAGRKSAPRVLIVLPHQGFWYPDYGPVREVLEKGGASVKVASSDMSPATPHDAKINPRVQPDMTIQRARAGDFDAVYFTGAMALEYVGDGAQADAARKLTRAMLDDNKVVAGLCAGVKVLADNGFLKGKPAARTTHIKGKVREDDADWRGDLPAVVAGNIVTGGDFRHAPEFAAKLLEVLGKR